MPRTRAASAGSVPAGAALAFAPRVCLGIRLPDEVLGWNDTDAGGQRMTPILSPEAIEALKWIDQFGDSRPVPAAFDDVVYALLNDGLIYQATADRVDLTADGRSFLSDEYD
ncbi:hypothetical protein BURCENBC7_AP6708 [Burkholderia cenocepacia BC7]|nr:hypothetical protein BURCENBC7_AP6708 [Burkholderia cenocepacia BC7]